MVEMFIDIQSTWVHKSMTTIYTVKHHTCKYYEANGELKETTKKSVSNSKIAKSTQKIISKYGKHFLNADFLKKTGVFEVVTTFDRDSFSFHTTFVQRFFLVYISNRKIAVLYKQYQHPLGNVFLLFFLVPNWIIPLFHLQHIHQSFISLLSFSLVINDVYTTSWLLFSCCSLLEKQKK